MAPGTRAPGRLVWADAAKGVCIVLVVLHHLTTKHYDLLVADGMGAERFWLATTDAIRPVRMPLFFLISGMFAAGAVRRPWSDVVRRKVATPYYLYVVWLMIHAALFSVLTALPMNRTRSWSELVGDLVLASTGLWYLYALALYFVLAKVLRRLDTRLLVAAAAVASASASLLPIESANRESLLEHFVYFLVGVLAPGLATRVLGWPGRHVTAALAAGSALVTVTAWLAGLPQSVTTLVVSIVGVPLAIRLVAAASTHGWFAAAASTLGRRSLPIYVLHVPLLALVHHLVVQVPALRALAQAPAGPLLLAFYPLLATAVLTAGCLVLHRVLVRAGLGPLFRLNMSTTPARSDRPHPGYIARMLPRVTLRAPLLVLLCGLLAATLVSAPSRAEGEESLAPRAGGPFALDLAGQWRFKAGDDPRWSDPDFDDSSWETMKVPQEGGQPYFADNDGFAWFRLEFDLPAGAKGTPLVASLGGIDDADEAFLNGVEIGSTGSFPPDEDSQWFEQRLYPVPAGAPNYGGRNVLAVRMNDFTGGGGWYRGPVGLYSKAALRSELYGLDTSRATEAERAAVRRKLERQAQALAGDSFRAYRQTLAKRFFHDGDTLRRRMSDLRALSEQYGPLRLRDTEVQIVRDDTSSAVIADTNRTIIGRNAKGERVVVQELEQDFLYFAGRSYKERGNRSRFFMDSVRSELEDQERDFAVYLPPSYLKKPKRSYPTVYLLHGINGGAAEWDTRNIDARIDRLVRERGIEESVVVMPDGESLWYVDSSASPWRSMFTREMVPLVDRWYRTRDERGMRGLTGVSMGGHGAFTIGWAHWKMFSSIASHMGALSLPPLAGSQEDQAENADQTPNLQVNRRTPEFLQRFRYFFDACEEDDFKFDDAARAMDGQLTAKLVPHRTVIYPEGRHNDECWVPRLYESFDLHSDNFRAMRR